MAAENETNDTTEADDFKVFTKVLTEVVSLTRELNATSRARLLRTLASMFDYPLGGPSSASINPEPGRIGVQGYAPSISVSSAPFSEDRALSPKQFMYAKRPMSDIERMACLAYYLTHYRDTPHFKTLDLSKLNTEAAQIKFSNPAQAVDNATRSGFLVQVGQAKKQLSANGELYVQALPDRAAAKEAVAHARRPRRARPRSPGASRTEDK